ncbi:MAG: glycosyltransferase [Candidatus Coatesbacteria bacterium]
MTPSTASPAPDLTLVLACYHEEAILEASVRRIIGTLEATRWNWEIVFVEDASRDRTRELLGRILDERRDPRLRTILHERNMGRGRTVADGFRAARGAVVGFIDVDLEVGPEYILPCVQAIRDGADVAVGRRVYKFSIRGLWRYALSTGYARLVHSLLPSSGVSDTESGYKFFRRETALMLIDRVTDPGWFWDTEIMCRAAEAACRVAEVPCLFQRDFRKRSTVRGVHDSLVYLGRLAAFRRTLAAETRLRASDSFWRERADAFADHYAARGPFVRFVRSFLGRREALLERWLRAAPGTRVLEAGCGHGPALVSLVAQGAQVTGLDVSEAMLERARHTLEAAGSRGHTLLCTSVETADLPAESFDLVLAVGLLDYLVGWREAFRRLVGWTKPGGQLIVTIPKRPSPFGFLRRGPGLMLRRVLFDLPPIVTAVTREELEDAAREAGVRLDEVASCQGTMWAVRATRPVAGHP